MSDRLDIVILGLAITSSWGNGHATTYRGLARELAARGHRITFLERDQTWYAEHRDLPHPSYCRTGIYRSLDELRDGYAGAVRAADLVLVGSDLPEGAEVAAWATRTAEGATAFYDIDTPVTLAQLAAGRCAYLRAEQVPRFDLYLSSTGGPILRRLEQRYGARRARPLYCSIDPELYQPRTAEPSWDLGYMGTYCEDRQPALERLLLATARDWRGGRFAVAGPQYPPSIAWPANVERIEHLAPDGHAGFYSRQRFTLNVTRAAMVAAGHSPSVRLFEAAACGTPIISDYWLGLETFFRLGVEILTARSTAEALQYLREVPESARRQLGERARRRVLAEHTAAHRAEELEGHAYALLERRSHALSA